MKYKETLPTPSNPCTSQDPPKLELKPLPSHLRYAFLGDNSSYPVIINNSLSDLEEEKLVKILRDYKTTIG